MFQGNTFSNSAFTVGQKVEGVEAVSTYLMVDINVESIKLCTWLLK